MRKLKMLSVQISLYYQLFDLKVRATLNIDNHTIGYLALQSLVSNHFRDSLLRIKDIKIRHNKMCICSFSWYKKLEIS